MGMNLVALAAAEAGRVLGRLEVGLFVVRVAVVSGWLSHRCIGINAALPMPNMYNASSTVIKPSPTLSPITPPGTKSRVPTACQVQIMANINNPMLVDSSTPK